MNNKNIILGFDKIDYIEVYKRQKVSHQYRWREAGKWRLLGFIPWSKWDNGYYPEDRYKRILKILTTKEEWEKKGFIEYEPKQGLYHKPYIRIYVRGGVLKQEFNSIEEMDIFIQELFHYNNYIKLNNNFIIYK